VGALVALLCIFEGVALPAGETQHIAKSYQGECK